MSLVAYAASDDSETSDVEESDAPQPTKAGDSNDPAFADDGKISDEDDYVPTTSTTGASYSSNGSRPSQNAVSTSSTNNTGLHSGSIPTTLSDLPAPKAVTTPQGGGDREDELEEEVKPKASQLADAPKPPPKKVKQPTRILLPALEKDSDDEDEESGKKTKPIKAAENSDLRSGLFALLPPPTHSSRKQTNRPLIPYTLTKRPAASKPTPTPSKPSTTTITAADTDLLPSQKHQSAFNALTGYESDSDEEDAGRRQSDFFSISSEADGASSSSSGLFVVKNSAPSLNQRDEDRLRTSDSISKDSSNVPSSSSQTKQTPSVSVISESPVSSSSSSVLASTSADSGNVAPHEINDSGDGNGDDDDGDNENEVSSTVGVPLVNQDAPLNFSSTMGGVSWSTTSLTSPMLPEMYAAGSTSGGASYWQHEHYAQGYGEDMEQEASSSSGSSNIQQYMEDEQFLRISGKRKRGQEDIQIIDANVDDCVDPSELVKGISEESSYQPHRKKDNMPSMQQRRKKQITYLAFQAKERELELKNAWSQNRMTKNQSRSKYGF